MSDETPAQQSQPMSRQEMTAEMERTAFQKKAVSKEEPTAVLEDAIQFFKERGYRAGMTGRPNKMYIMGKREGKLPRVNAEIFAQPNVGKGKVTMLTINGFGDELSTHLQAYTEHVRKRRTGK